MNQRMDANSNHSLFAQLQSFWYWRDLVANGELTHARTNCSVEVFSRDYTSAFTYRIFNSWPASIEVRSERGIWSTWESIY